MIWRFVKPIFQQVRIGNRSYLSKIDIQQVNMMYRCNGGGGGKPAPPPPGKKVETDANKASCQSCASILDLFEWQPVWAEVVVLIVYIPELIPFIQTLSDYISDKA